MTRPLANSSSAVRCQTLEFEIDEAHRKLSGIPSLRNNVKGRRGVGMRDHESIFGLCA
jgi:hypothetical protein